MLGLGYYAAKKRPPSHRTIRDAELTERIVRTHRDNYWVYGVRKVHATPQREGVPVARCTVERLMRSAGQRGISRRPGPLNPLLTRMHRFADPVGVSFGVQQWSVCGHG
ncbi:IS3 family transposase [Rhodococcus opacus]|uniref:IS3 family transposase n=1 Tax=Rhodococcus opacus TaxID=37919 RepID=UPI001C4960A5|nr:IS3 family transposase [Rhodococcus opacus]